MSACVVCGAELVTDYRDLLDGHTLLEEQEHCPKCGYAVEYHFGYGSETIGDETISWGWSDTGDQEAQYIHDEAAAVAKRRALLAQNGEVK